MDDHIQNPNVILVSTNCNCLSSLSLVYQQITRTFIVFCCSPGYWLWKGFPYTDFSSSSIDSIELIPYALKLFPIDACLFSRQSPSSAFSLGRLNCRQLSIERLSILGKRSRSFLLMSLEEMARATAATQMLAYSIQIASLLNKPYSVTGVTTLLIFCR